MARPIYTVEAVQHAHTLGVRVSNSFGVAVWDACRLAEDYPKADVQVHTDDHDYATDTGYWDGLTDDEREAFEAVVAAVRSRGPA
jgi:hypothetical protein